MEHKIFNSNVSLCADSLGAELKSLKIGGTEYIWQADPKYWGSSAPVIFPWVGGVRDGIMFYGKDSYKMPKNGFCGNYEFMLENKAGESLTFLLHDNDETREVYPFHFELRVTYAVKKEGMEQIFNIRNTGDKDIYFQAGAHTGYRLPIYKGDSFADYRLQFDNSDNTPCPLYVKGQVMMSQTRQVLKDGGIDLNKDLFDNLVLIFVNSKSRQLKVTNRNGRGFSMDYTGFNTICLWTPRNEAEFICIEPCIGTAFRDDDKSQDIRDKHDMVSLVPGGEFRVAFTVAAI